MKTYERVEVQLHTVATLYFTPWESQDPNLKNTSHQT
jgi:hypothetical protein